MTSAEDMRRKLILAFQMPTGQSIVSRSSSITNAFVNSVIPSIVPSIEEIDEALKILGMSHNDVRCSYCGDKSTEWDHLRPLVDKRRATGHITEIANLVPACGKCNQSKGNKSWRKWMLSDAPLSPTGRGIVGVEERMARLERYEQWKPPTRVEFEQIVGLKDWEHYWSLCERVNNEMRQAQDAADKLKARIIQGIKQKGPPSLPPTPERSGR